MSDSKVIVHNNQATLLDLVFQHLPTKTDLSDVLILMPDQPDGSEFREHLLRRVSGNGVLPPAILSLRSLIEQSTACEQPIFNNHARELMLVEVLRDSQKLKGKGNAWQLADELLKLFDELELSGHTADSLLDNLQNSNSELFLDDADKVSHLWKARVTQMEAEDVSDRIQIYSRGLESNAATQDYKKIIFAGFDWLQHKEIAWLQQCFETQSCSVLTSSTAPLLAQLKTADFPIEPTNEHTNFLDACFSDAPEILARSQQWTTNASLSESGKLASFCARSPEHEARFIDTQIRHWLSTGKRNIALVTEDRQLARRVSAILEHSNLNIHDDAGWPLSTTVAAGTLERWLECIDNEFPYRPLLDVLKSPFSHFPELNQQDVFHFERDIIEHEGIAGGLDNYRTAIKDRATRLESINPDYPARLLKLVEALKQAATPILELLDGEKTSSFLLHQWIQAVEDSFSKLGLEAGFRNDTAGQRLLQEIEDMRQAEAGRSIRFSWQEFRNWLKRALETHNFRPSREASPVRIMTLQQSLTGNFDAIIIAGMDNSQLPRPPARLIFFNDQVKQQLGLLSSTVSRERQFFQFRRLLESSDEVILSYSAQANGTPQLPSPWLAKLSTFHQLVYNRALPEPALAQHVDLDALMVQNPTARLPAKQPVASAPEQKRALLPPQISASSHQQLVDCPYKFFGSYSLGLKAPEDIVDQLNNRDYGTYVHRCLQAFHSDIPELPGPFTETLCDNNLSDASTMLLEISQVVFSPNAHNDLRHINWFNMWKKVIPEYLRWQQKRQQEWTVLATEQQAERPLTNDITLKGKLDRIDHGQSGNSVVDYKTGTAASKAEILSGENVQLSTYSLLVSQVREATYLSLKNNALKESGISGEELDTIATEVGERLEDLGNQLENNARLPANGDETSCQFCSFNGLCRKDMWQDELKASTATT